ncbi:putative MFS family arabinose efflux permease [Nitrospirillum amazonense]|uniref:Putative MFS family arabinose efflux permease n=1 Tax=Nitrospirillum amazonense TaxID=28077 RepID=A0A560FTH5_9PROT|nr:MFS transporter [Nitrospirillum amazonense]TWB24800.1 putative MFS family arabinose efflux permease [Nitrospirillum amazonense]
MSSPPSNATAPNPTPQDGPARKGWGGALRHPAFLRYWLARILSMGALQIQAVAAGWAIYDRTGSTMNLGLIGLAQFLPSVGLVLVTGHAADRLDRRLIITICVGVEAAAMAMTGVVLASPDLPVWLVYAAVMLFGAARAFEAPASSALLPNLVPKADFPNAVAISSSAMQVAGVLGPALGGVLYAGLHDWVFGVGAGFLVLAGLIVIGISAPSRAVTRAPVSWDGILGGVRYIRRQPIVLGAISLDLFAVLLGGATALLPALARDQFSADAGLLGLTGPMLLGVMRGAPGAGAILVGLTLAAWPLKRRVGPIMLACVGVFGLATIVFGLTRSPAIALLSLLVMGAVDMVSVFVRQTLVQLGTPDEMRGRVSAVSGLFIGASNQLGEFESGLTASWLGTELAVVVGGIGTVAVVALWCVLFPALRRADKLDWSTAT